MRTRQRLAIAAATVAILIGVAASPAQAIVTLSTGHVDVVDIDWNGSDLVVSVLDDTGALPVERSPADVAFDVLVAAKKTVPNPASPSCLGSPGSSVWILPQVENVNLLWAGWNTTEVASGVFVDNKVTLTLNDVIGPGELCIYTTGIGAPVVLFDSGNGVPDSQLVLRNVHKHANWAFTASGSYTVKFEVTGNKVGGGTETSGVVDFSFTVFNS